MSSYSIAEARNNLSKLVERAEQGETIEVTRHGKRVAFIVPGLPDAVKPNWRDAIARVLANPVEPIGDPVDSVALVRELRDEAH